MPCGISGVLLVRLLYPHGDKNPIGVSCDPPTSSGLDMLCSLSYGKRDHLVVANTHTGSSTRAFDSTHPSMVGILFTISVTRPLIMNGNLGSSRKALVSLLQKVA